MAALFPRIAGLHCIQVIKEEWQARTLFAKIKNSSQEQKSPFKKEQDKFQKKFSPADRPVVAQRGFHPRGASAGQLRPLQAHLHQQLHRCTTTVLGSLFSHTASPASFMNETSQLIVQALSLVSPLTPSPQHFFKNISGTSKKKGHDTWEAAGCWRSRKHRQQRPQRAQEWTPRHTYHTKPGRDTLQ